MNPTEHTLTFSPSYAQFVLYDVQAPYGPEEETLWSRPGEAKGQVSVRQAEVAIALLEDMDVQLQLSLYSGQAAPVTGSWDLAVEASLLVSSGELGVRDVVQDRPELSVQVPAGWVRLRAYGRITDDTQLYRVQVWPESRPTTS